MVNNIGDIAATATLDIQPFQQNTRNLKTYLRGVDTSLKGLEQSFQNSGKSLNSMKALYSQTGSALKDYQTLLDKQKEKYEQLVSETGDLNQATVEQKQAIAGARAEMMTTASKVENLTGKYASLSKEMAIQESVFTKLGDKAVAFGGKMESVGGNLEKMGGTATKYVTAPLALGIGAVTKAAIDWESAFAGVKKTVDEVVDSNGKVTYSYKELESDLRSLAKELPSTHREIAEVAEAAGQLGIQTENVKSFTKTMIDLGESTNMGAEEAATTLARFANITQMSQSDFSKLGSVLVELGNNFATTETEIAAMGLRLAGAGTQIGMSEAEIMAFAAALSSVGVEAEAGGSAFSKVMVQMQLATEKGMGSFDELIALGEKTGVSFDQMVNAVNKGGKPLKAISEQMGLTSRQLRGMYKEADDSAIALQNFAEVAGMTNAEFANMFKQDPSKAIMRFVEGLSKAEEQGKSAIAVLDDMDITEVRLRDSLLRAANASGVFEGAIESGNKAWEENTALLDEANKRYETTESKLKMLKNEAVDAAIEFGGPFVDALRDALESSKPLMKSLGDMAKAFSELEPEQQQNIVKWAGIALAVGPVLKVFGSVITVTGKATGAIGTFSKGIGKLAGRNAEKVALEGLASGIGTVGTTSAASSGMSGVGGFTAAVGGINPVVAGVVATLAVGGLAFLAWDKTVGESNRRTARWGSDIGKEADKSLTKYQEFSEQASIALQTLDGNLANSANNIKTAFEGMNQDISKSAEEANKKIKESYEQLPEYLRKDLEKAVKEQEASNNKSVEISNKLSAETQAILEKHNGEVKNLSDAEKQVIENNARQMNAEKVRIMNLSAEEEKQILASLNNDVDEMTKDQRKNAIKSLQEFHSEQEQESIKTNKLLIDTLGKDTEEYKAAHDKLVTQNKLATEEIAVQMVKLMEANGFSTAEMQDQLNKLGLSYWTQQDVIKRASDNISTSTGLIAKNTAGMSKETRDANDQWKKLVWDEKKAEVKTNAQEEVTKAIQSKDGWNNMKLILKNADLTSNAKEVIFNSIMEVGKWKDLPIDKKLLKAENVDLIQGLAESEQALDRYNKMSPNLKTLVADGPAKLTINDTEKALKEYNNLPPNLKVLLGNNESVNEKILDAQAKLSIYNILNPQHKLLTGDSSNVINSATTGGEALDAFNRNNPAMKNLTGDSNNVVNSATAGDLALNAFAQNNPAGKSLVAYDNASSNANSATESVGSFWRLPDVITKTLNVVGDWLGFENGTDFHPGGMAMVNDQKGPMYRELVTLPNGASFIPEGRNVFLPLPRGSKVMKASETKSLFPRYENGIPFNNTGIASLTSKLRTAQNSGKLISSDKQREVFGINSIGDNTSLIYAINQLQNAIMSSSNEQLDILRGILSKESNVVFDEYDVTRRVNKNNAWSELTRKF